MDRRPRALERSVFALSAYGQQLWNDVNAMRSNLLHHQPPSHWDGQPLVDPVGGDRPTPTTSGDAIGAAGDADGQAGWSAWIAAYAALTSVLAGPHGDSDFAVHEAYRALVAPEDAVTAFATAGAAWVTAGATARLPDPGSA